MVVKIKLAPDTVDTITDSFSSTMTSGAPWSEYLYFEEVTHLFWTEFGAVLCSRDYRELDNSVWLEFERASDATYFKLKWC
jgi:hypothetical protein